MATRKTTPSNIKLGDFDLVAFKAQKDQITAAAYAAVSERAEQIKTLLLEIREISTATGVQISLYDLTNALSDACDTVDSDWNSSGC